MIAELHCKSSFIFLNFNMARARHASFVGVEAISHDFTCSFTISCAYHWARCHDGSWIWVFRSVPWMMPEDKKRKIRTLWTEFATLDLQARTWFGLSNCTEGRPMLVWATMENYWKNVWDIDTEGWAPCCGRHLHLLWRCTVFYWCSMCSYLYSIHLLLKRCFPCPWVCKLSRLGPVHCILRVQDGGGTFSIVWELLSDRVWEAQAQAQARPSFWYVVNACVLSWQACPQFTFSQIAQMGSLHDKMLRAAAGSLWFQRRVEKQRIAGAAQSLGFAAVCLLKGNA